MTAREVHSGDSPVPPGRQGVRYEGASVRDGLREAVDYRGDVTLELRDGSRLTGYLFSYEPRAKDPHVKLYPAQPGAARVTVSVDHIAAVAVTGDDRASGRSWEAWVRRHEERKRLLAEGRDAPDVEPQPEELG